MAQQPIAGRQLLEALYKAGYASYNTRRVVIDIPINDIPVIYTETLGDAGIIEIIEAVSEVEVKLRSTTEEEPSGEYTILSGTGSDSRSGTSGKHHE